MLKIIVLGMDNTGKTTLCEQLSSKMNLKWVKSLGPNKTKEELSNYLTTELKTAENSVFERFSFFDEMIYGKILRGESKFSFKDDLFKVLKEVKPVIIYCRPDIKDIYNWNDREQMEGVIEQSTTLISAWDNLIKEITLKGCFNKILNWDYKKDKLENLIERIKG